MKTFAAATALVALGLFGFAGTASADHLFEPGSLTCHDHSDVYHVEWTAVDGAIKYTADIKCGYLADDGGDLEFVLSGQGSASSHDGMEASIPYDEIGLWVSTADGDVFVLANSGDICTAYARGLESISTSAPAPRAISSFSGLPAVAMTRAPNAFPIWTAASPTPPAAAWMRSVSPRLIGARQTKAAYDVG